MSKLEERKVGENRFWCRSRLGGSLGGGVGGGRRGGGGGGRVRVCLNE